MFVYEIYRHVNLFVLVSLPYFSLGYNFKFWLTESPVNFRNILNSLLPFCNPLELISITFWLNQAHSLWLILYFNVRKSEPVYTGFSSDAIWVSNKTNFGINMRNSMCYWSKSFLVLVLVLRWTSGVVMGRQYTTGSSIQSQTVNPSKHDTEIHIMKLWIYKKSYMWTAEWRIIWRKIIAVIYAIFAVTKRKLEKIQACTGFEPYLCDTSAELYQLN